MQGKTRRQAIWNWEWLFAPSLSDFLFSLRTTITSLIALSIAMWMELGQPQWAAMTIWIVAQKTIGESLSKAHWRIVGTLLGAVAAIVLVSAAPQQPWLFFPMLAFWIGLCAGLGTLCSNFRSYMFVLMGFTCAIISISAITDSDHVFQIAIARSTYIILGVICEMTVALVCEPNASSRAHAAIREYLREIIIMTASVVREILLKRSPPARDLYDTFSHVMALSDRIEFSAIETGRSRSMTAYAQGTLGEATRFLSRGLGMRTRLSLSVHENGPEVSPLIASFVTTLENVPHLLTTQEGEQVLRDQTDRLVADCETSIARTAAQEDSSADRAFLVEQQIVLQGLVLLMREFSLLMHCFSGMESERKTVSRLRLVRFPDWRAALINGLRSFVSVLLAALIWEVTGWPTGSLVVMFVCVVCARFAAFPNPLVASKTFFFGAVWAVLAAVVPVFLIMPVTSDYPLFCFFVAIPMVIGGLVNRHAATAAVGASFVNFFPFMLLPENHSRVDEIQWFNTSLALLMGLGLGGMIFRYLLPFGVGHFLKVFDRFICKKMKEITTLPECVSDQVWVGGIVQGMENFIAHCKAQDLARVDLWLHSTFAVMTAGRNLIYLESKLTDKALPADIVAHIRKAIPSFLSMLHKTQPSTGDVTDAMQHLREREQKEKSPLLRAKLTDVIGAMAIVNAELSSHVVASRRLADWKL